MATGHAVNGTHSVHALVRLLKSSADPPSGLGPSKIEIASLAWSNPSFRAANKGEVIGEWILTVLGQAKKTRQERGAIPASPIADSRYWALLCGILTTPPPAARPLKTWLLPLLNRFQLDRMVTELLALHSSQVLAPARAALVVLWPMAEKKISIDAWAECLNAIFDVCTQWERVDDDVCWVCSAVVGAYRNTLANVGNKKRILELNPSSMIVQLYNSFLTTRLLSWLSVVCANLPVVSPPSTKRLQDSIYAAGTDTLFSLDALKQPLDTLFAALPSSKPHISSLLTIFPRLFTSFLSATHRYRSALLDSVSGTLEVKEEIRKRGMDFVGKYWTLVRDSASHQEGLEVERWKSVIGVFKIVEKERLFVALSIRGTQSDTTSDDHGGYLALKEVRDKAIEVLEISGASSQDCGAELVVLSTQILDALVQIEYDHVGSVLERVLSALINVPPPLFHSVTSPASEFLTHVLEYHTKTRTVHTYALALLGAVVTITVLPTSWTSYSLSATSTFHLAYHLPALARALRTSLTPAQITPLGVSVLQAVEHAWRAFKDAYQEEEVCKRRKVIGDRDRSGRRARLVPVQARGFSFTGRVAGTILSNLSSNAYTKNDEYSLELLWSDVGKLGWTIIWDCLGEKIGQGGERDAVKGTDDKKRKHAAETSPSFTPYLHIVISATLRFLYEIRARVSLPLGNCDQLEETQVGALLNVARDEVTSPELVLEIIRILLWHASGTRDYEHQKRMEIQPIFTVTFDILATCPLSKQIWSGVSAALTRENLGLAILFVLTDRWIDALDALASTESLERFISLIHAVFLDLPDETFLQPDYTIITTRGVLLNLLQNAQFWELHNIRAAFLSSVLTLTTPLSSYRFPTADSGSPSLATAVAQIELACNVYGLLQYVPPEYFTRTVRAELVKRAMAGDVQICTGFEGADGQRSETKGKDMDKDNTKRRRKSRVEEADNRVSAEELKDLSCRLASIRTFLRRMGQFLHTPSHTTSLFFVNHLLSPPSCISSPSKALTSLTLDLIQLHIVNILRSQEPEAVASASSVISTLAAARPFSRPTSQEAWTHTIVHSSVLKFIEHLTSDFGPTSLPDQNKRALRTLLEALESGLIPPAEKIIERNTIGLDQFPSSTQINAWSCAISLTGWLGVNSQIVSIPFGLALATSTIRSRNTTKLDCETCSSVLVLLFEGLWCTPDASHHAHLDVLTTFYAVNGGDPGSDAERVMDAHVTQALKKLSVEDFSYLLDTLAEGIGGSGLQVGYRERLIHLGKVLLHNAPQGTLKDIQNFTGRCFNLFADREEIYGGPPQLRLQCLEFIAGHCSDRPAGIRSTDLGSIWSLLHKTLSGASKHDAMTAFPIFHHIVTAVGALVRLRRDLVVHTLPHLSLVLRQLMMLCRCMRPQLGAKQSKMVTDTFPSWLSTSHPLSPDEARALARLLTSLTTKTVPKSHVYTHPPTSTKSQKADSLSKPFAKHASYVLIAYVDAFNDPLCIVSAEMRRELEPGLFALCGIVGEHSRDALMVSTLDSGGKMILKSLWKKYEKQRYVGRG